MIIVTVWACSVHRLAEAGRQSVCTSSTVALIEPFAATVCVRRVLDGVPILTVISSVARAVCRGQAFHFLRYDR